MRFLAISYPTDKATPEELNKDMEAEVAQGSQFFEQGFILEGYMDPTYSTAYLIIESPSAEEAQANLGLYPNAKAGLNTWQVYPLIGLPAISSSLQQRQQPLPAWWPPEQ